MKTKRQKQEAALKKLYSLYSKYLDGKYTPSNKDLEILWSKPLKYQDTLIVKKIRRVENEIVILEQKLKSL
jgi:hypothetical protein